jgi:hypothetical protein
MLLRLNDGNGLMGRRKVLGRSKRGGRPEQTRQRGTTPRPPSMTYDPYLIKLARSLEAARQQPKAPSEH